jgi:hypothetical protein
MLNSVIEMFPIEAPGVEARGEVRICGQIRGRSEAQDKEGADHGRDDITKCQKSLHERADKRSISHSLQC